MLNPRVSLRGLMAALLALMVQLAVGAMVPDAQAQAALTTAPICHTDSDAGDGSGTPAPAHAPECLVCPLCAAVQGSAAVLLPAVADAATPPRAPVQIRSELPPPSTAPPSVDWPPNQARAPPSLS